MPMLPGLVWTASVALAGVGAGPPPEGLRRIPVRLNPETADIEVEL